MSSTTTTSAATSNEHGKRREQWRLSPDRVCKLLDKDRRFAVAYNRMCHNSLTSLKNASNATQITTNLSGQTDHLAIEGEYRRSVALKRILNQAMAFAIAMKDITTVFVTRRLHKYKQLTDHQARLANQLATLYTVEFQQFKSKMAELAQNYDDLNRFKGRPMFNPNVKSKYPPLVDFVDAGQMTLSEFESSERRVAGESYKYLSNVSRYTHSTVRGAVFAHNYHCRHIADTYGSEAVAQWFNTITTETFARLERVNAFLSSPAIVAGSKLMKRCIGREIAAEKRNRRNLKNQDN